MTTTPTHVPIAAEPATTRLSRVLTMVPWLMNRQGIDIEQAARTLGVSRTQIEADLALLFVCGTPGHMPDDLIEAEWEEGRVYIRNADEIAKPLRFTRDEALALTVGLRTLLDVPGLSERDAVDRALATLSAAAGESAEAGERISVNLERDDEDVLREARVAIADGKQVHLRYVVASRDEMTERDVAPMRLFTADGHWYLEGWCLAAEAMRTFRLDRVESLTVSDLPASVPPQARVSDLSQGFFTPSPDAASARLRLGSRACWIIDYYPCFDVERHPGGADVSLVLGDGLWLRRLVLHLGGQAQVLSPSSLRASVAQEAQHALAGYGVSGDVVEEAARR